MRLSATMTSHLALLCVTLTHTTHALPAQRESAAIAREFASENSYGRPVTLYSASRHGQYKSLAPPPPLPPSHVRYRWVRRRRFSRCFRHQPSWHSRRDPTPGFAAGPLFPVTVLVAARLVAHGGRALGG